MAAGMPEANVLYAVTGTVIVGLVFFVLAVLKTAKEPWGRAVPPHVVELASEEGGSPTATAESTDEPLPKPDEKRLDADETDSSTSGDTPDPLSTNDEKKLGADSTSKATPVALAKEREEDEKKKSESKQPVAEPESDSESESESDEKSEAKKS
jgi:hypothetical protein